MTERIPADTAIPAPAPAVLFEQFDDEGVLYDSESATLTELNLTAMLVWLSCDGRSDIASIAAALAEETGADVETVLAGTRAAVATFLDQGVVRLVDPAATSEA